MDAWERCVEIGVQRAKRVRVESRWIFVGDRGDAKRPRESLGRALRDGSRGCRLGRGTGASVARRADKDESRQEHDAGAEQQEQFPHGTEPTRRADWSNDEEPAAAAQARFIFFSSAVNRGWPRNGANTNEVLIPYTAPARSSYARSSQSIAASSSPRPVWTYAM